METRQVVGIKKHDDDEINTKYVELMTGLAERFARGELGQKDLMPSRDEALRRQGLPKARSARHASSAAIHRRRAVACACPIQLQSWRRRLSRQRQVVAAHCGLIYGRSRACLGFPNALLLDT